MSKPLYALAAALMFQFAVPAVAQQTTGSLNDDTQVLLAQIQADKRAVVLRSMEFTDEEARGFTPIYDEYQKERKELVQRKVNELNKFAANYGSMTDDAAKDILKEWFKIQEDDTSLVEKYSKRFDRVLPKTKVLRFVQVEHKLNAVLELQALRVVPLAK